MKSTRGIMLALALVMTVFPIVARAQVSMEGIFPMQVGRFVFTPDQVKTFGPTGPMILAGVPDHILRVYEGFMVKHPGPAFTYPNFGNFVQLQYDVPSRLPAFTCHIRGVFDQTAEARFYGHPASTQLAPMQQSDVNVVGAGMRMGVNGNVLNAYGGEGSTVEFVIAYRALPATQALLAAAVPEVPLP